MTAENRRFHRYAIEIAAELTVGVHTFSAATQNLSAGGLGVVLASPLEDGSKVGVAIFLTQDGIEDPDQEPFETRATVAWTAPTDEGTHMAGLRFSDVTDAQKEQLDVFLNALG